MTGTARKDFVIALIGAVGSPLSETRNQLASALTAYGYTGILVRLSDSFRFASPKLLALAKDRMESEKADSGADDGEYGTIRRNMIVGTAARETYEANSKDRKNACLGRLAVRVIERLRREPSAEPRCFIVHSLKRPEELEFLRSIYGQRVLAVGLHTARAERRTRLVERIQRTSGRSSTCEELAVRLIGLDEKERETSFGQNVEGIFDKCDFFLTSSTREMRLQQQIERFLRLVFLHPFETPSADEAGMVNAYMSGLRSASMARHVGASIASRDGDLVAVGFNEVPKFGGGPYTSADLTDGRDFTRGHDENSVQKHALIEQLVALAGESGLLKAGVSTEAAIADLKKSEFAADMLATNVTEYGRDVHAEMAAITSAARRGVPLDSCTLYCTTFPCHNCAKHIIACGISEVVFIEPYPKSFAETFYRDSLSVDVEISGKLLVRSFSGVAPRRYPSLFAWRERRNKKDGTTIDASPRAAQPWFELEPHASNDELLAREAANTAESEKPLAELFDLKKVFEFFLSPTGPGARDTRGSPPAQRELAFHEQSNERAGE